MQLPGQLFIRFGGLGVGSQLGLVLGLVLWLRLGGGGWRLVTSVPALGAAHC